VKLQIRITPTAISDVQEMIAYIAEDNPSAATKMANTIYTSVEKLVDFPEMGGSLSVKIKIKTDYRFLVCRIYLVFYKIEGEFVSVYRVLNGMRDYLSILFVEELSASD
jgi:addiction module RelE/StbE family toxin